MTITFDRDEALALLRELVAIRSYPGEETAVQQHVATWLASHSILPALEQTANGQPNVIAKLENGRGPTLLLNGHVDTVLAVEGWERDPWQGWVDGDRLYGLGAGDMKCGVVVNMLVARALHTNRQDWRGTLIFSSVTDEEAYSYGARALLESGFHADAAIVTEPAFTEAIIGAPGKVLIRITAVGKAAHGFYPQEGINAAIELARFVAAVCDAVPPLSHPRIPSSQTILSFQAGSAQYVITLPERATALLTRQIVPGETAESVVEKLTAFAASLQSPATFSFAIEPPYYPPFEFAEPDHPFTQAFSAASAAVLGAPTPCGYSAGVSDANLTSGQAGIPTIMYGPHAGAFHQCQEWVDVTSLAPCAQVVAETALRFLDGSAAPGTGL